MNPLFYEMSYSCVRSISITDNEAQGQSAKLEDANGVIL